MLFPCSGGSLFGKAFGSEVVVLPVVIPKRNRRCKRCISKPNRGAQWAQVKKRASWVRQAMLLRCFEGCVLGSLVFFIGSGRSVWHWRSPQHRSKNGVIELARPCCFPVPEAAFLCHWARQTMLFPCSGGSLFGKAFGSEVVVLPVVIPKRNRRCKRCISKPNRGANWAPKLQNLLFLKILDATFDIEDHSNAGRKTVSLSSPGHAVSLFRRQPFWEGFWVRSRGFAGRDTQTQPKVPTVYFEGNWRCKLRPKAAKLSFFIDSGRNVWHWRSPQHRSKNGVIELARPCCFPVPEAAFLGRLLGQKSWFCRSWYPNATEGANGVFRRQLEVQIAPQSCKTSFFYRFRAQRLTLKITPAQVSEVSPAAAQIVSFLAVPAATFDTEDHPSTGQKMGSFSSPGHAVSLFWRLRFGKPWRQAMLFPCPEGSVVGKSFQSEVEVRLKAKSRCEMRPEVSPEAAKIVSFLKVPAATFDTEDHPSTGQKMGSFSSPSHAVSLFWRLRFGKPWRQTMLFPCPEGSVVGKSFQSEVEVRVKAKSRCEMRPEVSPEAAKIVSFLKVPAATFDTEDHPSTGQKTSFLNSPGHAVALFWRLRFGKPCLFYRFRPQRWTFFFYRFRPQRLTLKITPAQVEKRCHWARQTMLFPCSGGSLFGKAFGSEVVVLPVVISKRNRRCQRCISKAIGGANCAPKLQNLLFL